MMEPAEVPVKKYSPGGFTNTVTATTSQNQNVSQANAARPGMNSSHRRSSSGVYNDEGLASTAAIRALYNKNPVAVAPHIVENMTGGSKQSNVAADQGSFGQNGMATSMPRQEVNGKLHFPRRADVTATSTPNDVVTF